MTIPHIPIVRLGENYKSLDVYELKDHRSGEVVALVSQANGGLIKKDRKKLLNIESRRSLHDLMEIIRISAKIFMEDELPLGDILQSPQEYARQLSSTSGMPQSMCYENMNKVAYVLENIKTVIKGLTRGLDIDSLYWGYGRHDDVPVSYYPLADMLGAVLPSNSPGVNSLWIPSLALNVPVFIKPGAQEPWTPFRIIQSLIKAGMPKEMLSFYPTNHEGASSLIECTDKSLVFGDRQTTAKYLNNADIEIHGPGYSKIVIAEDCIDHWADYIDVLYDSVMANGGRSCINASTIVVPRFGQAIAKVLAKRMNKVVELPLDQPEALLSAFATPAVADGINSRIDEHLEIAGAIDVTAQLRAGNRKVECAGSVFLKPTVIFCDSFDHPLARSEFMFPYVAVVESNSDSLITDIGDTLVATIITEDQGLMKQAMRAPHIDRLNLGPIPTVRVHWDQPHEGNIFEFLYSRRALQMADNLQEKPPLNFSGSPNNKVLFGEGCLDQLLAVLNEKKIKKLLLVTDSGIKKAGHVNKVLELLTQAGIEWILFDEVKENPTSADVEKCVLAVDGQHCELIIGLGGGSSLDTAKACNFVLSGGGKMQDYRGIGKANFDMLPLVAIPTTSGTGSECQSFALIVDETTGQKMACGDQGAVAETVILDPCLTVTQPEKVTAHTAIDALVHSLETAVCVKRNDISEKYAFEAFKLIVTNLPVVLKDPNNVTARGRMQLAAAYAGVAIENSMLGAAHAMANPLTAAVGMTHGQAVGMMISGVIQFNSRNPEVAHIYRDLAVYGGVVDKDDSLAVALKKLLLTVKEMLISTEIQNSIKDYGVQQDNLKVLSQEAAKQWTGTFNPVHMEESDFFNLYQANYNGLELKVNL